MTELDLTPEAKPKRYIWSWRNWLMLVTLLGLAGFMVFKVLDSATVYYRNVDEAVADRQELGNSKFRMQGRVTNEPEKNQLGELEFQMAFGDAIAKVIHRGDEPTELFEKNINVVTEGAWQGDTFISKQILVKHSEEYKEENPNRFESENSENETTKATT